MSTRGSKCQGRGGLLRHTGVRKMTTDRSHDDDETHLRAGTVFGASEAGGRWVLLEARELKQHQTIATVRGPAGTASACGGCGLARAPRGFTRGVRCRLGRRVVSVSAEQSYPHAHGEGKVVDAAHSYVAALR